MKTLRLKNPPAIIPDAFKRSHPQRSIEPLATKGARAVQVETTAAKRGKLRAEAEALFRRHDDNNP